MMNDQIMSHFEFRHLPKHLQKASYPFHTIAKFIETNIPDGEERDVCFRKLLEAKDCAVRACL